MRQKSRKSIVPQAETDPNQEPGKTSRAPATLSTPNISGNTIFLYRQSNFHGEDLDAANPDPQQNGMKLQEAELQFYADVDPFSRLNLVLSVHPESVSTSGQVQEKWVVEPEEAFVESSNVLPSVDLRIGKLKAVMGKHNMLHTHAFPFVQAPLANQELLGEEGLNDVGVSAARTGVLVVFSILVAPAALASRFVKGVVGQLLLAWMAGIVGLTISFFLSYQFDLPSGATIVCVLTGLFFLSLVARGKFLGQARH